MFGGTKGKFNGLNFFQDDEQRRKPSGRRRKLPPQQFRADEWYGDIMESLDNRNDGDDDEYVEDVVVSKPARSPSLGVENRRRRRPLPPEDGDLYYEEERYKRRPRNANADRGRPATRRRNGDWGSTEVSSWFSDDDACDVEPVGQDEYGRSRRPRRAKEDETWSFTAILDGIFGVNREEVDINAAMYNRQMGLDKPDRRKRRPERQRHPANAYPYVEERKETTTSGQKEEDLDSMDVVDVDVIIEEEETKVSDRKRERTIEERAAAFERVPPSSVPAWGPSGSVGIDARTKATLDALEDIREATRKMEQKEEQCIEAKEDIVVLKACVDGHCLYSSIPEFFASPSYFFLLCVQGF